MTVGLNKAPNLDRLPLQFEFVDDFVQFITTDEWTSVLTDTGTVAVGDAANGIAVITASDGSEADNDQAYLHTTNELWKFVADKPISFEALVQFTEANTDDANILVGLMDAVAADALKDDGGGPKDSYSGAVFFKVDGGTVWQVESSKTTTQTTTTTSITAGGAAYQRLTIEWRPISSTEGEVTFAIDGQYLVNSDNLPIVHTVVFTSATEMQLVFGVKNGDTNVEVLNVDLVRCIQRR